MSHITPTFIISILVALAVHEWAHAFVAYRLGDATAKMEGRLTLNPIAHLDPIGTILFLLVGFGWGKPVPVDPRAFRKPKRDSALVALAGPASNLLLATAATVMLAIVGEQGTVLAQGMPGGLVDSPVVIRLMRILMSELIWINLILMAFNLLPIAPLDGSKVLRPFIPLRYEEDYLRLMQYGWQILLILIILGHFLNVPILWWWIELIVNPILSVFSAIVGLV